MKSFAPRFPALPRREPKVRRERFSCSFAQSISGVGLRRLAESPRCWQKHFGGQWGAIAIVAEPHLTPEILASRTWRRRYRWATNVERSFRPATNVGRVFASHKCGFLPLRNKKAVTGRVGSRLETALEPPDVGEKRAPPYITQAVNFVHLIKIHRPSHLPWPRQHEARRGHARASKRSGTPSTG